MREKQEKKKINTKEKSPKIIKQNKISWSISIINSVRKISFTFQTIFLKEEFQTQ